VDGKPQTVDEIRDWLTETVASYLEIPTDDIDPEAELVQYGIDSMYKLELADAIIEVFQTELGEEFFQHEPTIDGIAAWLHTVVSAGAGDR
jgi:acyl carrier protein